MHRCLILGIAGLCFNLSQAQTSYVGLGVSCGAYTQAYPGCPVPGFHISGPIFDGLELRGTIESIVVASSLGVDLLYPVLLKSTRAELYLGGGASVRLLGFSPVGADLRGILGGIYPLDRKPIPIDLFAELRLYVQGELAGFPTLEGRAGINFPF